jgi:anti-sigma factor RsiW
MNHPSGDELVLLAYGELPGSQAGDLEAHIESCPACRQQLGQIERARVALGVAIPRRRPLRVWVGVTLAAAAVVAVVLIGKPGPAPGADTGWRPTTTWSATAGYVAGGTVMVDIDAQLTRLEQEKNHGRP